jgi:hypothetical protein
MTVTIGRILHVVGVPATGNGTDIAPSIVTRVWSEDTVNVTVFPDAAAPVPATSVRIVADEATARGINAEAEYPQTLAFWPARF